MARIDSIPPFPHLLYEKAGWRGIPVEVLAVRGTFDLGKDGEPMRLAAQQTPLQFGDSFAGPVETDPLGAVIERDGDLVAGKPGTDVLLSGALRSADDRPVREWLAAVRVGRLTKALRVTGPRQFERGLFGWGITPADAVSSVPLDYRLAFGGRLSLPCDDGRCELHFPANPAGVGWLPTAQTVSRLSKLQRRTVSAWIDAQNRLPAPQLEDPLLPLRHPMRHQPPQGFGPIARWWQPRLGYQGTLDAQWQAERHPDPPDDYDPRYLQSAPQDQVTPGHLQGDESVILAGCLPEGRVTTALPGVAVQAMTTFDSGRQQVRPLALDTVRFDLSSRRCVLVWRGLFDPRDPPIEITITAMPLAQWRRAVETAADAAGAHG
jgi:hypothetical protein